MSLMYKQASARVSTWHTIKRLGILIAVLLVIFAASPAPAKADGGPYVDPQLFDKLKEGQQIAVIAFQDTNTATIDLFVSILDQTGESHEVAFFVPLGVKATWFSVKEQDSFTFNDLLTGQLDAAIFEDYLQDWQFISSLFAGALLTNGVWLTPLWLPLLLTGCGDVPPPTSTFQTDSSEVSIFDLDEATDLEELISSTGLDPSVRETLSRLRGQQIAVVNLRTKARGTASGLAGISGSIGEPGLHFSWMTTLTPSESGVTYAYPLGTGAAWAHPIEMTRVYIIAPEGLELTVQYPKLGVNRSGFERKEWSYEPRIAGSGKAPAYAVDKAVSQFVGPSYKQEGPLNIWRLTYTNSNAAEDIAITIKESSGSSFGAGLRRAGPELAFFVGMMVAALLWILSWRFLMPRLLGRNRRASSLWRFSLSYMGWNALLFLPGVVIYVIFSFGEHEALALSILALLFGGASVLAFALKDLHRLGAGAGQNIRAFIIVTLVSGGAYFLFVLGYARLVGAI